ncbi:MAG TPA: ABC transporter permease [Aliidongia sp.]|uniref:ABC transporter permease n=1 Tax=Aliidongia sp. TaxID=1914230 RepID=UPI002DDD04F5|nr:ABC transporter permease [Aliidongia sp.]HEV2677515.1 ABC transporter permease [Aliidongia sp.]
MRIGRWDRERIADRALLAGVVLGCWWIGARWLPSYVLPSPERVAVKLAQLSATGDLWRNLATTLLRVVAGFAASILIGLPIGLAAGRFGRFGRLVSPILPIMNTVSSAIWAIFALLWFGLSPLATIFVVFMTGLPLIVGNVREGAEAVDPGLVEMGLTLQLSRMDVLRKIYLPSVLPYLFAGARLAFGFGWRVSLVAEALGATSGVGYRLRQASDLNQTDQVFAWTLVQVAMMLLIETAAIRPLERHLFRWRRPVARSDGSP